MIRDRKMYVAPTPFGLLKGVAHRRTLIVPVALEIPDEFEQVGLVVRREVEQLVAKYEFDLRSNELNTELISNPNAGREHSFRALRLRSESDEQVMTRDELTEPDAPNDFVEGS